MQVDKFLLYLYELFLIIVKLFSRRFFKLFDNTLNLRISMKYKFVVSGAADLSFCSVDAEEKGYKLGKEIVKQNGILITGATTGLPYWAAKGAKEAGGLSVGVSPAATYAAHVKTYHLPTEYFDFIIYTGFGYSGRNLILTKSADAVIVGCGGFGTLNEFTIALEDNKPLGIMTGTGGTAEEVSYLLEHIKDPHRHGKGKVVFSDNPTELVAKLKKMIENEHKEAKVDKQIGE